MNSELKLVIFEEKKRLQNLLDLLDEQYNLILGKDLIKLENISSQIEIAGKNVAEIEIKRRKLINEEDFKLLMERTEDQHIKDVYIQIKQILNNLTMQKNTNDTLLKQKLFFTNKMINMIKPSKGIGTYNSYGKVGK